MLMENTLATEYKNAYYVIITCFSYFFSPVGIQIKAVLISSHLVFSDRKVVYILKYLLPLNTLTKVGMELLHIMTNFLSK